MVFAHSHVETGIVLGTSLADKDIACLYNLRTELLESESFAFRFTAVL